jgi:hypothetical protein
MITLDVLGRVVVGMGISVTVALTVELGFEKWVIFVGIINF